MNPSDVIEQRYRLERLLGTGGMSEVWLAEDTRLSRWVAVKILRDSLSGREDELVDTLLQEARVVAKLQHPNIVAVYDFGTHEGHHFLVMEYVQGHSIRQLLQTQGRLSEPEATRHGVQIATALHYAHEQNVIHCDVKPENILVNEQGVAKIADFGVAESVSRTLAPEQMRDVLGTIAYLAPEVIQGAPADPRADVYSLGLTVYEMVAGRLPFTGSSAAALAGQRLGQPAAPLRSFAMNASPELESVLARALAISPQDRYATAGAFANALRSVPVRGAAVPAPVPAPAQGPAARTRHDTSRVRRGAPPPSDGWSSTGIAALVGAVLLALGIGIAAAVILSQDDDNGGGDETPTPGTPTQTTATAAPTTPTREPTTPAATETPTQTPTSQPATATPTATQTATSQPATATPTATTAVVSPTATP